MNATPFTAVSKIEIPPLTVYAKLQDLHPLLTFLESRGIKYDGPFNAAPQLKPPAQEPVLPSPAPQPEFNLEEEIDRLLPPAPSMEPAPEVIHDKPKRTHSSPMNRDEWHPKIIDYVTIMGDSPTGVTADNVAEYYKIHRSTVLLMMNELKYKGVLELVPSTKRNHHFRLKQG